MERASDRFENVATRAEDPAFINYSSGTTGWPMGVLHAHRAMIGHLTGAEVVFDFYPEHRDTIWSPADWSWLAADGRADAVLARRLPVVASRMKSSIPMPRLI